MDAPSPTAHVTQYRRPWWKTARHWWPLLIFIFFTGLALVLHSNGGQYRVMTGTAERIIETIAPLESARVAQIHVQIGDSVMPGDIIAQLDTSIIDAESSVLKERIIQSRLESQLEQLTLERQFAASLQRAEQDLRQAVMQYEIDSVEHAAVLEELARLEPLLNQQLIDAGALVAKRSRERVLKQILALAPENIDSLRADVERANQQQALATERLKSMSALSSATTEDNVEAVNLINIRRDGYTLRARQAGVIAEIFARPGDVIEPGGSIASLLIHGPARIVGFLPESNLSAIEIGTSANIYPSVSIQQSGVIPAHVIQISPAVYSLPERVSPIRGQVVRGRRVIFALDTDQPLVPGESVSIEIGPKILQLFSSTN